MKSYLNGAKRVLVKLAGDDFMDQTTAKDKKTIYVGLRDLEEFDSSKQASFNTFIDQVDCLASFLEQKKTEQASIH